MRLKNIKTTMTDRNPYVYGAQGLHGRIRDAEFEVQLTFMVTADEYFRLQTLINCDVPINDTQPEHVESQTDERPALSPTLKALPPKRF